MKKYYSILTLAFLICSGALFAQTENDAPLSEHAPTDKPHNIVGTEGLEEYDKLIEPYVQKARKALPKAKKKYIKGLKKGEAFFLTTRIYDTEGRFEQIFVRVTEWKKDQVKGTIANELNAVQGYRYGQEIEFPEMAVLDWLITKPNGEEEGNFVGKYLDTLR